MKHYNQQGRDATEFIPGCGVAGAGKNGEERHNEVEKRERLVQTFLIISGFLVAYTREEAQHFIVLIFSLYLISTILYYIFVSRTKNSFAVNVLAFYSSCIYTILILAILELSLTDGFSDFVFYPLFGLLTAIFTFSLLYPETSEWFVKGSEEFFKKQEEKHPKLTKLTMLSLIIILIIIMIRIMYYYYLTRL